jgi:hypothetical protein
MKALLIVAGLFFSIFGGVVAYYAASDPGHEYDFNFVLPIDARQMPKPFIPPSISYGEVEQTPPDGRAEAAEMRGLPQPSTVSESGRR